MFEIVGYIYCVLNSIKCSSEKISASLSFIKFYFHHKCKTSIKIKPDLLVIQLSEITKTGVSISILDGKLVINQWN